MNKNNKIPARFLDNRYLLIKSRLDKLSNRQIERIVNNIDEICFDTYNYDEENNKYCPLAIALNLDVSIVDPTDEKIKNELGKTFNPVNILKGERGEFYRESRRADLISVCFDIIFERSEDMINAVEDYFALNGLLGELD